MVEEGSVVGILFNPALFEGRWLLEILIGLSRIMRFFGHTWVYMSTIKVEVIRSSKLFYRIHYGNL